MRRTHIPARAQAPESCSLKPVCVEGDAPPPLCDIPSGCCSFTGPWTVTRSSLRMLRRVAAFCRPLRPVLLLVVFPHSRSPVVVVLGLCWMWRDVSLGRYRSCQHGAVSGVGSIVASFVSTECPKGRGMWGILGKPLKRAFRRCMG